MSSTEVHYGKIKKVNLRGMSVEEWCEKKCQKASIEKPEWIESWIDAFRYSEELYDKYHIYKNMEVYKKIDCIETSDEDISVMYSNRDGSYTFFTQFYNGGTCLEEVLDNLIEEYI
jgi:hypothetical protein